MAFWKYFLIRVAVFVPRFIVFLILQLGAIFSAIAAALIAFCISYLFFRPQRDAAAAAMRSAVSPEARRERAKRKVTDGDIEDSLVAENPEVTINSAQKPAKPADRAGQIPKDFLAN